jgi:HSP20 family protein
MIVRYWQPLREIETLRRQMDRLFDEVTPVVSEQLAWTPAIELKEEDSQFILRAQLPGINAKDVDIQVTREAVAISGEHRHEHKVEEKGFFKSEFNYGSFRRVINLPAAVQNDQVKAEFKEGILTLVLPKVVKVENTVVKVNLLDAEPAVEAPASTEAAVKATHN